MPTTAEEVEKFSWGQLLYLAGDNAEALGINGTGSPLVVSVGTLPSRSCDHHGHSSRPSRGCLGNTERRYWQALPGVPSPPIGSTTWHAHAEQRR